MIATARGAVPVERLRPGMRVVTRDNGLRRVYWVGRRDIAFPELTDSPNLSPVLIRAGALGDGRPFRDMLVSPAHRMLVPRDIALMATDEPEALVAARLLVGLPGIGPAACLGVSYLHLLCDRHQVILADGAWTESFHPDDATLAALASGPRKEILDLFPDVATIGAARRFSAARVTLDGEGQGFR